MKQSDSNLENSTGQTIGDVKSQDDNLLLTATNSGSPANGDLKPSTIVIYRGLQVSLELLEQTAIVSRNPITGVYGVTDGSTSLSDQ